MAEAVVENHEACIDCAIDITRKSLDDLLAEAAAADGQV
jgi:hypothetical protein